MSTPRKHLFGLIVLVGFATFIFPGFIRLGVIYCDNQKPMVESVCALTKLTPSNGELYLRYLSVGATMILVAILAGIISRSHPTMSIKTHMLAVLFALSSSMILFFNPPLVMMATGSSIKYIHHAKDFQLGILSVAVPLIGLLAGYLFNWWVKNDEINHQSAR